MSARLAVTLVLVLHVAAAAADTAPEPIEPPPDTAEGADYEAEEFALEPHDTLSGADVEVGIGAGGRSGSGPRRTRRVRFAADSLEAAAREGTGDPLAGAVVGGRSRYGSFQLGKSREQWGRGLVLGAPVAPWADDRARTVRGKSEDLARWEAGSKVRLGALLGRSNGKSLAGARLGRGRFAAGMVGRKRGGRAGSVALTGDPAIEIAVDHRGRTRVEAAVQRRVHDAEIRLRIRRGAEGFTTLSDPRLAGPASATAIGVAIPLGAIRLGGFASAWRFAPGVDGARGALEVIAPLGADGLLALGLEEQHGVRRLTTLGGATRQGMWCYWSDRSGPVRLALRQENWGAGRLTGRGVRAATEAEFAISGPAGTRIGLAHVVYRVKSGESLYRSEREADRTILRALTGEGERSRIEIRFPAAGGSVHAALNLTGAERAMRPQWTLDWSRRARLGRERASEGER